MQHECMAYVDKPAKKLFPSHTQMFNLVANCLDPSDILLFLASIRTYSHFNGEKPSFINPKILKLFGMQKIGKTCAWTK